MIDAFLWERIWKKYIGSAVGLHCENTGTPFITTVNMVSSQASISIKNIKVITYKQLQWLDQREVSF